MYVLSLTRQLLWGKIAEFSFKKWCTRQVYTLLDIQFLSLIFGSHTQISRPLAQYLFFFLLKKLSFLLQIIRVIIDDFKLLNNWKYFWKSVVVCISIWINLTARVRYLKSKYVSPILSWIFLFFLYCILSQIWLHFLKLLSYSPLAAEVLQCL